MPSPDEKPLWLKPEEAGLLRSMLEQGSFPGRFARVVVRLQDKLVGLGKEEKQKKQKTVFPRRVEPTEQDK